MLALMIATCILPHVEASSYENIEFEQQQLHQSFLTQSHSQLFNPTNSPQPPAAATNSLTVPGTATLATPVLNTTGTVADYHQVRFPHRDFHRFIELAWISSTVVGIFLFLVEVGLICYIKFYPISAVAGLTGSVVMAPILVMFVVFSLTFYKRLAHFKLTITEQFLKQV
jgi:hypothetical protein